MPPDSRSIDHLWVGLVDPSRIDVTSPLLILAQLQSFWSAVLIQPHQASRQAAEGWIAMAEFLIDQVHGQALFSELEGVLLQALTQAQRKAPMGLCGDGLIWTGASRGISASGIVCSVIWVELAAQPGL